jgi:hypothetical protein
MGYSMIGAALVGTSRRRLPGPEPALKLQMRSGAVNVTYITFSWFRSELSFYLAFSSS